MPCGLVASSTYSTSPITISPFQLIFAHRIYVSYRLVSTYQSPASGLVENQATVDQFLHLFVFVCVFVRQPRPSSRFLVSTLLDLLARLAKTTVLSLTSSPRDPYDSRSHRLPTSVARPRIGLHLTHSIACSRILRERNLILSSPFPHSNSLRGLTTYAIPESRVHKVLAPIVYE